MHVQESMSVVQRRLPPLLDLAGSALDEAAGWAIDGQGGGCQPPGAMVHDLALHIAAGSEPPRGTNVADIDLAGWEGGTQGEARRAGRPLCRKARWPGAKGFAVLLSHDIDQIHDRELFRWLGDINHLRRHWFHAERGDTAACLRRIIRPLWRPRDPMHQFEAMRAIEGRHGWRSTFFLLEDLYWARKGGRFDWTHPAFQRISRFLLDEGCELGIHGSAYSHDQSDWWTSQRQRFAELYGREALGARNHYLTLKVPESWSSQHQAGIAYDSTFGYANQLGAPGGFCFPFRVAKDPAGMKPDLIELPLTIMDQTLFRYLNLDGARALAAAQEQILKVQQQGGLATILWHNNFFYEEEYRDWEETYAALLDWLAPRQPWVACGHEIAAWWAARNETKLTHLGEGGAEQAWEVRAAMPISGLALEVLGLRPGDDIRCDRPLERIELGQDRLTLLVPPLRAGECLCFGVRRPALAR